MLIQNSLDQITKLYHFTDKRNLSSIRNLGGIWPMSCLRAASIVILAAGGNQ